MSDERYKKLGSERPKYLDDNFDKVYEFYKDKAKNLGFEGDLKFIKERGWVLIYVVI